MATFDLSRRDWFKLSAAGVSFFSYSNWLPALARGAADTKKKHKSCILLWMDGGPSHKDTFDLKPDSKDAGDFKPIATSADGIEISEHLPKLATVMHHAAILRGMSTGEGAHGRAKYFLHTGYKEGVGGLSYPSLGALAAKELGDESFPLPNFVSVGNRSYGAGFLGARHQPLIVTDPNRGVENLKTVVNDTQFEKRIDLLDDLEKSFHREYQATAGVDHHVTYRRAVRMMQSNEAKAFDLSQVPSTESDKYGTHPFGRGCLLARRLVEAGVPFVEVNLGGWDTHENNSDRVKELSGRVDAPMTALVSDLKERGMLDDVLVVWMGEFGRTPKLNTRGTKPGRDHYPRAWSSVLVGGGIKGGQVVGKTDAEGAAVVDRPINVLDFMATLCEVIGIDYTKKNTSPGGRPIRIVDKGANPVKELLG